MVKLLEFWNFLINFAQYACTSRICKFNILLSKSIFTMYAYLSNFFKIYFSDKLKISSLFK